MMHNHWPRHRGSIELAGRGSRRAVCVAVFLTLVCCGRSYCGFPPHSVSPSGQEASAARNRNHTPVIVQDDLGRAFRFARPPSRIVSLSPGYTETLFALGAGDRVVGVDDYSDYPPEALSRAKVGGGHHANLERIVALEPDFVVALVEQEEVDALVARGIPAVKLFPKDFQGVLDTILLLGEVTGTNQRAQKIVETMKQRLDFIGKHVKGLRPPRIFLELDGTDATRPFTPGPHSFIGDMIRAAGGSNVAHDIRTPSGQMSLEAIVAQDPEIIVLTDSKNPINPQRREDLLNRQSWSGITAIRKGAVFSMDNVFFFRPSPRFVDGIELLARTFHPEAFR